MNAEGDRGIMTVYNDEREGSEKLYLEQLKRDSLRSGFTAATDGREYCLTPSASSHVGRLVAFLTLSLLLQQSLSVGVLPTKWEMPAPRSLEEWVDAWSARQLSDSEEWKRAFYRFLDDFELEW